MKLNFAEGEPVAESRYQELVFVDDHRPSDPDGKEILVDQEDGFGDRDAVLGLPGQPAPGDEDRGPPLSVPLGLIRVPHLRHRLIGEPVVMEREAGHLGDPPHGLLDVLERSRRGSIVVDDVVDRLARVEPHRGAGKWVEIVQLVGRRRPSGFEVEGPAPSRRPHDGDAHLEEHERDDHHQGLDRRRPGPGPTASP